MNRSNTDTLAYALMLTSMVLVVIANSTGLLSGRIIPWLVTPVAIVLGAVCVYRLLKGRRQGDG